MVVQSVSGIKPNSYEKIQNKNISFKSNSPSDSNNLTSLNEDQKREEIKKEVKKIYNKGFITGVILTAGFCLFDFLGEHLSHKFLGNTEKVSDIHIPFKWIFRKN